MVHVLDMLLTALQTGRCVMMGCVKASCTQERRARGAVTPQTPSQPLWTRCELPNPRKIPQPKPTARKLPLLAQETSSEEAAKATFIKSCSCKTQFLTSNSWKASEVGSSHVLWKASLHAPLSFPIKIPHAGLFIPSAHSSQIVCPSDRWKIHSVFEGV